MFWTCIEGIASYQAQSKILEEINFRVQGKSDTGLSSEVRQGAKLYYLFGQHDRGSKNWQLVIIYLGVLLSWIIGGWILAGYL